MIESALAVALPGDFFVWCFAAGAIAPLLMIRFIPRKLAWAIFALMANLALAFVAISRRPHTTSMIQWIALLATSVAALWSLFSLAIRPPRSESHDDDSRRTHLESLRRVAHVSALVAGVVAGVLLVFMLAVRGVYAVLEIINGAPIVQHTLFEFGFDGLAMIGVLGVACLAEMLATRERRLIAVFFWLSALGAYWAALLWPIYERLDDGTYARTGGVLVSIVGLSTVVTVFVVGQGVRRQRIRWRAVIQNPNALLRDPAEWPGLRTTAGAIGILLVFLICFQIVVPARVGPVGDALSACLTACCAAAAGGSLFALVGRRWSANLADVAMGLLTLAAAALAIAFVPGSATSLDERFPMIFNALLIALAVMTWLWVWIGKVWEQQLDHGQPWTAAGRLASQTQSFAFYSACIALVVASLMSVWPRLKPIASADDSIGRVASAVAGHLLLLLVLLWAGRTVRRSSFGLLTVLTILSLIGFILVRTGPLASTVLHAALESG